MQVPPKVQWALVTAVHEGKMIVSLRTSDRTIAAADARFAQIEIKRGIMPFGGATIRFVRDCGWGNAMRYLLTAEEFDKDSASTSTAQYEAWVAALDGCLQSIESLNALCEEKFGNYAPTLFTGRLHRQ